MRFSKAFVYAFIFVALIVFVASSAHATNGMRLIGVGAIQRAMGGASVGLPLDTAATITNPAGITKLDKRMDFGVSFFVPSVEHTASGAFPGIIANDGNKVRSDADGFVIPAFGMVIPVTDRLAFGLGAFGVSGEGVDYPTNLYSNVTYVDYAFMKFAPTIAYKVLDNLAIGFAPNVDLARMSFEAGGLGSAAHNGSTAYGIGFTIGLLYDINEQFSLGLAYESRQWFEDFDFNTTSGHDSLDFDQPATGTLGLGFRPYESLRFAFDVQWIDWSTTIGHFQPGYVLNSSGATPFDMAWHDQVVFKLGAEFDLTPRFTLRGGYNYGKHPLHSSRAFESLAFPAITEHHVTAGLGYNFNEDLQVNLGAMYAPQVSLDVANEAQQFISSGNTKMSQYSVDFGLSYTFD